MGETVTLIFADREPLIIPMEVAREEYDRLSSLTLHHSEDIRFYAALTAAIGPMPPLPLGLMPDGRTRAETMIAEWRERHKDLN